MDSLLIHLGHSLIYNICEMSSAKKPSHFPKCYGFLFGRAKNMDDILFLQFKNYQNFYIHRSLVIFVLSEKLTKTTRDIKSKMIFDLEIKNKNVQF